jgi:hypothetical protein
VSNFYALYAPALATGDEKSLLHTQLKVNREALLWKLEGVSEQERRRPRTASGTNLIGQVKHLARVECSYLCDAFDRARPEFAWESDEDAALGELSEMYAKPSETTEAIISGYHAATAAADATLADLDLDATGRHPPTGLRVSLRWMILTVLVDTARHVGQADVLREHTDGATGWYRDWTSRPAEVDAEHQQRYLARVRGEVDDDSWHSYLRARAG